MQEQTHEMSGHASGIYDAAVQNQRCRALLNYIIGKEIALDAPAKLTLGARTKALRSSEPDALRQSTQSKRW